MAETSSQAAQHGAGAHVVPLNTLALVLAALLGLTAVTVLAAGVSLGELGIWVAMGIATLKGALVLLYFMHLRWGGMVYAIFLAGTLMFVALFIGMVTADTADYQAEVTPLEQRLNATP